MAGLRKARPDATQSLRRSTATDHDEGQKDLVYAASGILAVHTSALSAFDLREDRPAISAAQAPAMPARVALPTALDHLWT